ncbi:Kef-type potassium/proton antiporter, CPA2 family [Rhodovulum sp. ES.010]|uniref:monovalent cation:proton antiporter-2 (CPA2) family protein n=1 Tax=Rhodovulum sp. ES.010 TaxID=1882821 RepID=UPI00092679BB|nr:monovalent cation:proton antiporter-2 (CPA2) family protein [Rhodovulum sp. ES.010]SIO12918.1 Kef-type potassium/proton antiporter, CPA2 family [Rhodovulum sp. ES.010]
MEFALLQATVYLGAAVIAVPLAARLGLGSVLGYLLAGIALGLVPGLGADSESLQHFAEFGVVLMLFLIGLELEPRALWEMRHRLIGLGGLQVLLTTAAGFAVASALGLEWRAALAVGMIFALSSTAIVLQTLTEKRLMPTQGGRATFSVLLTQDIAVIPMLALLPLLAVAPAAHLGPDGSVVRSGLDAVGDAHGAVTIIEGLPAWGVTLVTLGAVAAVILGGHYLTRPLFRFVHMARLREMYTFMALLIVVGIAVLMSAVGLSPALGTFLAGVVLADSEFRHELESNIEPFKGLLLGLFFITVGAGIDFGVLFGEPARILGLTLAMVAMKGAILYGLAILFKLRGRDRWLFTLGLAQAGEFGFVLVSFSLQQSVLTTQLGQTLLIVIALSMLLTPLLFILHDVLARRMHVDGASPAKPDAIDEQRAVIIAGVGRFGQVVNRMLQMSGYRATVLDNDLNRVQLLRTFGFTAFFGDPTRPEILSAAGLDEAQVLVAALEDPQDTTKLVRYVRQVRPDLSIVARAHDRVHAYELYRAGATQIVREMFDSSLRAARYVLEDLGVSDYEAHELEFAFYKHDRATLRELAELWVPGVPTDENPDYLKRARELNKELETALASREDISQVEDGKADADAATEKGRGADATA